MKEKNDLFEVLSAYCDCPYVSNLHFEPYRRRAIHAFKVHVRAEDYSLKDLGDLYTYLYGEKITFTDYNQVKQAFR